MTSTPTSQSLPVAGSLPAHVYTLLCYRPNGYDSARNCIIGRSDSAFEFRTFHSADDAAAAWVAKEQEDKTSGREYAAWELTLLIDGKEQCFDGRADELERLFDEFQEKLNIAKGQAA